MNKLLTFAFACFFAGAPFVVHAGTVVTPVTKTVEVQHDVKTTTVVPASKDTVVVPSKDVKVVAPTTGDHGDVVVPKDHKC